MIGARALRVAETAIVAVMWAALCIGSAVLALTVPVYTSAMTQALGVPRSSGLSSADVVRLSGSVRALVADAHYDPLPATWKGSPAFDEAAVSHLLDVRAVISAARLVTGAAALLLALYVSTVIATHHIGRLRSGLRAAAVILAGAVVAALLAAFSDFEWLFTRFHGLFFQGGTWTFPADSMLIRLFPEPFWVASGASWAALVLLSAALLAAVAQWLCPPSSSTSASRTAEIV